MSGKKNGSYATMGIITIINILLVLCLAVFSTLTLSSARSDAQLSKINAEAVLDYYEADAKAAALAAEFAGGDDKEMTAVLPVSDYQDLNISLVREDDGSISVLQWNTSVNEKSMEGYTEDTLPLLGAD